MRLEEAIGVVTQFRLNIHRHQRRGYGVMIQRREAPRLKQALTLVKNAAMEHEEFKRKVEDNHHGKTRAALEECIRYGAAVRALRIAHRLNPADIVGVSLAELLRVEDGVKFPSASVVGSLARAHNMSPNEYIAAVARGLSTRALRPRREAPRAKRLAGR
jgi:hypothetical protein